MSIVTVLAHPLTVRAELPVSPLVLAIAAVYVLLMASALAGRLLRKATPIDDDAALRHDDDPLPQASWARAAFWVIRGVGLALFLLAIVAARLGDVSQVRNIAPALTVGAGWPMLTLAAMVLGGVWWWVNPLDTLARPITSLGAGEGSGVAEDGTWAPVWWAIVPAAAWMFYLTVWFSALEPRTVGVVLILYTVTTLAGCLAVGRRTWLWRVEFFTVFFGLLTSARKRRARWKPPEGAAALLGVVAGGALFGVFRDSDLGTFIAYGPRAALYSRIGVVLFMAAAGLAAHAAARRSIPGTVAVGLAPMSAMLVLALAIARNRLTTSLQLLPIAASNPLGGDLDLFGTRMNGLNPRPLGDVGPVWLQSGLLLAGAVAGVVLARRYARSHRTGVAGTRFGPRTSAGVVLFLLGTLLGVGVAAAAAI